MRKPVGYIVTWQGQPMRDARGIIRKEVGRLFVPGCEATIFKTRPQAVRAMRRSIRAWGGAGAPINEAKHWSVLRLVQPYKHEPWYHGFSRRPVKR
jgi:hypothetical protein